MVTQLCLYVTIIQEISVGFMEIMKQMKERLMYRQAQNCRQYNIFPPNTVSSTSFSVKDKYICCLLYLYTDQATMMSIKVILPGMYILI